MFAVKRIVEYDIYYRFFSVT